MDSPILENIFSLIKITTRSERAVYLQLADGILDLIKDGTLKSGQKLPSSRALSEVLKINRITVSKAFDELHTQGWLEGYVGRGTFVSSHIPELIPHKLGNSTVGTNKKSGFTINDEKYIHNPIFVPKAELHLDDGYPDPTQAPLKEFYRAYRNQLTRSGLYDKFGSYNDPEGSFFYRQAVSTYLNETRGLKTTARNILSIRGTLMGINLVCNALIAPGDVVVSGLPGWQRAEHNFIHAKAEHIGIAVDQYGIVIDELKTICKRKKVRMVYVTPHHHYPTTVSLRIDRRLELLKLSLEYGFIIFEDDYDFDFHYSHRPLLPLASADENGMVIYCGSFSKSFSPAFRMGYLAASENVVNHLSNVRVLLDRQGDHITDNAMADLLNDGTIQRYARKSLAVYRKRRDYFCCLLQNELDNLVSFSIPEGGMTVWTKFDRSINLEQLSKKAYSEDLYFSDGKIHKYSGFDENATRLGFASSTEDNLMKSVAIIKNLIHS